MFKFFSQDSIELGIFYSCYEFILNRDDYLHEPSFLKRVFKLFMRSELTNLIKQIKDYTVAKTARCQMLRACCHPFFRNWRLICFVDKFS